MVLDPTGMGISPAETEERVEDEEKIDPEKLPALKRELAEAKQARERLMETYRRTQNGAVQEGYNAVNSHYHELAKQVKELEQQLAAKGWLISKSGDSGFKVNLETAKTGTKVFKISEVFGDAPVNDGQAFPARLSAAGNIPEQVRKVIIDQYTYKGDEADMRYSDIPEGDNVYQAEPEKEPEKVETQEAA